jgi:hypothetical protein
MSNACMPTPPANPFAGMSASPCEALAALKDAQLQLVAGQAVASCRFGDQEIRFSRSNETELRLLIARLSAECDHARGVKRSARIGPHRTWTLNRGFSHGGWSY